MTNNSLDFATSIIFTGFGIVIPNVKDWESIYLTGCFGKGTFSRGKPSYTETQKHTHFLEYNSKEFLHLLRLKSDCWLNRIEQREIIKSDLLRVNVLTKDILNNDCRDFSNGIARKLYSLRYSFIGRKESKYILIESDLSTISQSFSDISFSQLIGCLDRNCTEAQYTYELNEFLHLSNEEASYLVFEKRYDILNNNLLNAIVTHSLWETFTDPNSNFILYFAAYVFFRKSGWTPKCGSKFGVDFLLYKGGPYLTHSEFGVILLQFNNDNQNWQRPSQLIRWVDFTRTNRLLESVVKRTLLCYISQIHKLTPIVNNPFEEVGKNFEFSLYVITRWKPVSKY